MPPTMLLETLSAVRRRAKVLSVLLGLGIVLAALVGLVLGTVLLDYLLRLAPWPRLVLISLSLGVGGWLLWRYLIRPALARLSLSDLAGRLEDAFPEFDDRLRSTVSFVQVQTPGSEFMKGRTVEQATSLAARVDLNRGLLLRPVMLSLAGGIASLAALLGLAAVGGDYTDIALSRLLSPFSQVEWPKNVNITAVAGWPAHDRLHQGQRFTITMDLSAKKLEAGFKPVAYYQIDGGAVQQLVMQPTANAQQFQVTLTAGTGKSMKVWIEADDDATEPRELSIVPRLAIQGVRAVVSPPAYALPPGADPKLLSQELDLSSGPGIVTYGSSVELQVSFNKNLKDQTSLALIDASAEKNQQTLLSGINQWGGSGSFRSVRFLATQNLAFGIKGTDEHGFENPALEQYQLQVRPDQKPMVYIEQPRRNEQFTAVAAFPLQVVAEDDFAIAELTLVVEKKKSGSTTRPATGPSSWRIALPAPSPIQSPSDRRRFGLDWIWDLAATDPQYQMNLQPGDILEYYVEARDNFNHDNQQHEPAQSGRLQITIISEEELLRLVAEELRVQTEVVRAIHLDQLRNLDETRALRREAAEKGDFDGTLRRIASRLGTQESTLASRTHQSANELESIESRLVSNRIDNKNLRDKTAAMRNQLRDTANLPMTDAARELSGAGAEDQSPAGARSKSLDSGATHQSRAAEELASVIQQMEEFAVYEVLKRELEMALAEQLRLMAQFEELAKGKLGRRPEDLSPAERRQLSGVSEAQRGLAERVAKLTGELEKAGKGGKEPTPQTQAMRDAAERSRNHNVSGEQSSAGQAIDDNRQSDARGHQRKAEIGLRVMIESINRARQWQIERLKRQLAELEQKVQRLIRSQAAHNADNLLLRIAAEEIRADAVKAELQELAIKAARDPSVLQTPELRSLRRMQEASLRNARTYAGEALAIEKHGQVISAALHSAANSMDRALEHLVENRLAAAYAPPQVDALAALEDALRKIALAREDLDEQIEQEERDSIREALEKVRAQQIEINKVTIGIESKRPSPEAMLARIEEHSAREQVDLEGGLAQKMRQIAERLAKVDGMVFAWAARDVAGSMEQVKQALSKAQTGAVTQAEQRRIVEQITALIEAMNDRQKPSDYVSPPQPPSDGTPPPPGTPQMPTIAELRLLLALQTAINKSTLTISQLKTPDRQKLTDLGLRQAELQELFVQLVQKAAGADVRPRKLDGPPR